MTETRAGAADESAVGEFVAVARTGDVPPGWVLRVRAGERDVALANDAGTIRAFANACTHAGGPLGDNRLKLDCLVECPWHGALFDVRTAEVRRGPARKGLRTYPVKIVDDTVYIAL